MRRLGEKSVTRLEPVYKVVERLLDFYYDHGGEEIEIEFRRNSIREIEIKRDSVSQ